MNREKLIERYLIETGATEYPFCRKIKNTEVVDGEYANWLEGELLKNLGELTGEPSSRLLDGVDLLELYCKKCKHYPEGKPCIRCKFYYVNGKNSKVLEDLFIKINAV